MARYDGRGFVGDVGGPTPPLSERCGGAITSHRTNRVEPTNRFGQTPHTLPATPRASGRPSRVFPGETNN